MGLCLKKQVYTECGAFKRCAPNKNSRGCSFPIPACSLFVREAVCGCESAAVFVFTIVQCGHAWHCHSLCYNKEQSSWLKIKQKKTIPKISPSVHFCDSSSLSISTCRWCSLVWEHSVWSQATASYCWSNFGRHLGFRISKCEQLDEEDC